MRESKQKKEEFKFQEYFDELRKINEEFEQGNLDIEQAIKKFERGLYLAQKLKERLKAFENKIEEIKIKFNNNLKKEKEEDEINF